MPCGCDTHCKCEPKCCTVEDCNGDNCKCDKMEKEIIFEPDMNLTIH